MDLAGQLSTWSVSSFQISWPFLQGYIQSISWTVLELRQKILRLPPTAHRKLAILTEYPTEHQTVSISDASKTRDMTNLQQALPSMVKNWKRNFLKNKAEVFTLDIHWLFKNKLDLSIPAGRRWCAQCIENKKDEAVGRPQRGLTRRLEGTCWCQACASEKAGQKQSRRQPRMLHRRAQESAAFPEVHAWSSDQTCFRLRVNR